MISHKLALWISIAVLGIWVLAAFFVWPHEPAKALGTLVCVVIGTWALKGLARDDAGDRPPLVIVTDWEDVKPTWRELRLRDKAVRLCDVSGERQAFQKGRSQGVAYPDQGRIIWAINRPSAISRGRAFTI